MSDTPAGWRTRATDTLAAAGHYLWSGWGSLASILILFAAWELAAQQLGSLILPAPREALGSLANLLDRGETWSDLLATTRRALAGFGLSMLAGSVLGGLAGVSVTASMMSRPIVTLLVGTPPIAWLVLALLWFGAGDGTPIFTVFIACFPIIFVGAMQGTRTLDGQLKEMARMFGQIGRAHV